MLVRVLWWEVGLYGREGRLVGTGKGEGVLVTMFFRFFLIKKRESSFLNAVENQYYFLREIWRNPSIVRI